MRSTFYLVGLMALSHSILTAQFFPPGELGRFEYSVIPDMKDLDLKAYSITLRGGKRFKNTFVGLGLNYSKYDISFFNTPLSSDFSSYEQTHNLNFNISVRKVLKNSWALNLIASPTLSSNFAEGIGSEDFLFNSFLLASKSWKPKKGTTTFSFGLAYWTFLGEPALIPALSFTRKFNSSWSFSLGIPRTGLDYQLNERHGLSARASFRGFYANNSDSVSFEGLGFLENTKLRYNTLDLGLEHRYKIQPNFTTITRIGYLPNNRLEIMDDDHNLIYDFEAGSALYFTMGLTFNLNFNTNDKTKKSAHQSLIKTSLP
ncbi:DUF6268 family outer membrane beta-barrel protein [Poritiphilus flavus]|uniref:DUF6268 domain-containing protein n=1 Tax=Poritiphilus flavus TaxID=2697053 RepID=A0A6L9EB82_9FLAO|nr:DUF6268 family outer membrane beta-barrel protein [Poritiphilus flavus]NAS11944.1 hypothetical protein [Poritiphilus flavus]